MGWYAKKMLKNSMKMGTGIAMLHASNNMRRYQKNPSQYAQYHIPDEPQPRIQEPRVVSKYDYGLYESSLISIMGVVSSLMQTILKNDVEVERYVMQEAQDILNGLQDMLDMKRKKWENGN